MADFQVPDDVQEQVPAPETEGEIHAWEQIEPGRYMPRRICGSYRGGKLGWSFVVPSGSDGTEDR